MATTKKLLEVSCVVPYRRTGDHIEFCLVRPGHDNSWDFPKAICSTGECRKLLAVREAEAFAGLIGVADDHPLGQFESSRGAHAQSVTAFLMRVTEDAEAVDSTELVVRRWCLAEEARVRIRRKPLRRMIDEAMRRLAQDINRFGPAQSAL